MSFTLFRSHLDLAHRYWEQIITSDDIVIDATCGNGHDTLFLSSLHPKNLIAMDIQKEAVRSAKEKLPEDAQVEFILGCHSRFPEKIAPASVKLIVYNLGYLPGGDKQKTTVATTSLQSLQKAAELLLPGGAISVTCYPGHPEGKTEEATILKWANALPPKEWSCCHHRWLNRQDSPSLLLIQKSCIK